MKGFTYMKLKALNLFIFSLILFANDLNAQTLVGYHNAPYTRYEADQGALTNGATATTRSYNQWDLQSEASEQVCVNLSNTNASVQWTITAEGEGLVVRYSVPDGQSGVLDILVNNVDVGDLNLSSYYSWESLWNNGNPNNTGVTNQTPKMRFDEVRIKLASKIPAGGTLKLVRQSGNIHVDFAELESVPAAIASTGRVYTGNGSDLQTFIDNNGGNIIFLPPGVYNVNRDLFFGNANTSLRGAGMWYTQIHFTSGAANDGGLWAQSANISYSDLYLTTSRNSRSNSYKAINGAYTSGTTITNVWAEHFECGAWIAQYGVGPANTDGLTITNCRFRNNYADGVNLCKGTVNTIVQYCSFRNNGDDDMAIWSAEGRECRDNTFRYNTSENTWRASGVAIYGGYNNKAHNILIQDNVEVGIKVNNAFGGAGFNGGGMHEFYNIIIKRCGTYHDLFHRPVGAIEMGVYDWGAGTRVQNVRFSCIDIIDSKNDAIQMGKTSGDGYYNIVFQNISIDGTGREYPENGGAVGGRGYYFNFKGGLAGNANYCGMTYANRAGSAGSDQSTGGIGSMSWSQAGSCPTGCDDLISTNPNASSTTITSATSFGICDNPIMLTATNTVPAGNTVSSVKFYVDDVLQGTDNTSPYSMAWDNPTAGTHSIKAVSTYSGGTTSTSSTQTVTVIQGIYTATVAPTIDGLIDGLWSSFPANTLNNINTGAGNRANAADLSATFKLARDGTYLYVLVDVTDANQIKDNAIVAENWKDDKVELYLDFGNNKSTTIVGGSNDYSYGFVYSDNTIHVGTNTVTTGVTFNQSLKGGGTGYIMEVRIPWSSIGGVPIPGTYYGVEVQVNDDDDGGDRDTKMAWSENGSDVSWQNPSKWGTFQIAGCNNPLPVELISFKGELDNGTVLLNWSTSSEFNNKKFIIERSSDQWHWATIGEVVGARHTTTFKNYSFIDHSPIDGIAFYRLRQIDFDGTYAYSNLIAVKFIDQSIDISPNPFEDLITIKCNSLGSIDVKIYDLLGRKLFHETHKLDNGMLSLQPDLPGGTYLVTIQTESTIEMRKVIKK
jgi:hypothetical protein